MGREQQKKGYSLNRHRSAMLSRQRGVTFWHILLLVLVAVSLALCAHNKSLPYLQDKRPFDNLKLPGMPEFNFRTPTGNGASVSNSYIPNQNAAEENVEWLMASNNKTVRVQNPPPEAAYELQYPRNLSNGFYTVQVFSGYNSKSAYDLRKALQRDGYRAYIQQEQTQQGILFKVRVGQYKNRSDAFAMNTKLRLSYPKTMSGSFVLMRQ